MSRKNKQLLAPTFAPLPEGPAGQQSPGNHLWPRSFLQGGGERPAAAQGCPSLSSTPSICLGMAWAGWENSLSLTSWA